MVNVLQSEVCSLSISSYSVTFNILDSSTGKIVAGADARNRSDDCSKATTTSWCTPISLLA